MVQPAPQTTHLPHQQRHSMSNGFHTASQSSPHPPVGDALVLQKLLKEILAAPSALDEQSPTENAQLLRYLLSLEHTHSTAKQNLEPSINHVLFVDTLFALCIVVNATPELLALSAVDDTSWSLYLLSTLRTWLHNPAYATWASIVRQSIQVVLSTSFATPGIDTIALYDWLKETIGSPLNTPDALSSKIDIALPLVALRDDELIHLLPLVSRSTTSICRAINRCLQRNLQNHYDGPHTSAIVAIAATSVVLGSHEALPLRIAVRLFEMIMSEPRMLASPGDRGNVLIFWQWLDEHRDDLSESMAQEVQQHARASPDHLAVQELALKDLLISFQAFCSKSYEHERSQRPTPTFFRRRKRQPKDVHPLISAVTELFEAPREPSFGVYMRGALQSIQRIKSPAERSRIAALFDIARETSCILAKDTDVDGNCNICGAAASDGRSTKDDTTLNTTARQLYDLAWYVLENASNGESFALNGLALASSIVSHHPFTLSERPHEQLIRPVMALVSHKSEQIGESAVFLLCQLYSYDASTDDDAKRCALGRGAVVRALRQLARTPRFAARALLGLELVGMVANESDLLPILLELTTLLCTGASMIREATVMRVRSLAQARGKTIWALFSPHMRMVSVQVMEMSHKRPELLSSFASLLGIARADFMGRTQQYIIPIMVITGNEAGMGVLANALNHPIQRLIIDNIPQVLCSVLLQGTKQPGDLKHYLVRLDPGFAKLELEELIRMYPIDLSVEILQSSYDPGVSHRSIEGALSAVASCTGVTPTSTRRTPREAAQAFLRTYLERNWMGIVGQLADRLTGHRGRQSVTEQLRSIAALDKLASLLHECVEIMVPQMSASLQSAMLTEGIRYEAIKTWHGLLKRLDNGALKAIVLQTFCLTLTLWEDCDARERAELHEMLQWLITTKAGVVKDLAYHLPRLSAMQGLQDLADSFELHVGRRSKLGISRLFKALAEVCSNDNVMITEQGLIELRAMLQDREADLYMELLKEARDPNVDLMLRSLLNVCSRQPESTMSDLAIDCLGRLGAVDPVRYDGVSNKSRFVLLHNFEDEDAEETVRFVQILLDEHLVDAFTSETTSNTQNLLAWAIQELLRFCGLDETARAPIVANSPTDVQQRWMSFRRTVRDAMAPLLSSKWEAPVRGRKPEVTFPIFSSSPNYRRWLWRFLQNLLSHGHGNNAKQLFSVLSRIQREEDVDLCNFVLPYVFLNVSIHCTEAKRKELIAELKSVLSGEITAHGMAEEQGRLACESIFAIVDYLQHWMRSKKMYNTRILHEKARKLNRHLAPEDEESSDPSIQIVDRLLAAVPADTMSTAAYRCGSYSRALFYWEQHIRAKINGSTTAVELDGLYSHLQELYMHIDDPDGIEGIAALMQRSTIEQEILMHENAGRWAEAISGYELIAAEGQNSEKLQIGLWNALRQSGDYSTIVATVKVGDTSKGLANSQALTDIAIQSAWQTGAWAQLDSLIRASSEQSFDVLLGRLFQELRRDGDDVQILLEDLRARTGQDLASANVNSTRQCYDGLVRAHIVRELDDLVSLSKPAYEADTMHKQLRLDIMSPESVHRQQVLSVRRVVAESLLVRKKDPRAPTTSAAVYLQMAKAARKSGQMQSSYRALIRSLALSDSPLGNIEHAKWWWQQGQQLRGIQLLRKALDSKKLQTYTPDKFLAWFSIDDAQATMGKSPSEALLSKSRLLLAQWNEASENVNVSQQLRDYQVGVSGSQLEKPHFLLGRFWLRQIEAQVKKPPEQQDEDFLKGDYHRHTIIAYGKAMHFGTKYIFQTLPSFLQLWLDFGDAVKVVNPRVGNQQRRSDLISHRQQTLNYLNDKVKTFMSRYPTYLFTLALPQILSRMNHGDKACYANLETAISRLIVDYPRQTLWSFMAVVNSRDPMRAQRGNTLLAKIKQEAKRSGKDYIVKLISDAANMTQQLMALCVAPVAKNKTSLSLSRDLHFDRSITPNGLVVPIQANLTPLLPAHRGTFTMTSGGMMSKQHRAFDDSQPTIVSFLDEVDVMNSLQKPRKIQVRASDGQIYPFLVKPHDDLRKDARLMDFNSVVQKMIQRDPAARKRQLKIRTYAVVALNEEHGLCEWVRNTRAFRDVMIKAYRNRGIPMHYTEIKARLDEALNSPDPGLCFKKMVLDRFPPCFHDWLLDKFADPYQWFTARLSYARTLAVMSMVGFVLGLGDRHGENLLLDEMSGDVVHVDFNCLFEKGLTFERPERVPFRLTQNLVDALGVQGPEGCYRRTCELTLRILRRHSESFNTVLESFLHDPVGEFLKKVKKSATGDLEREEARKVLVVIAAKLKGSAGMGPTDKHVPLSIEAQADELIRQAMDNKLLAQMYIGWTAWL
ncbi:serine/threonine-protein kinase M1 [Savitreella phatthalungensis]